jgi:hypothetical protein
MLVFYTSRLFRHLDAISVKITDPGSFTSDDRDFARSPVIGTVSPPWTHSYLVRGLLTYLYRITSPVAPLSDTFWA